ncbi:uncharacterized protein SCODWIG_00192 [Saccharomycodes ludwigii]|uniref:AMP deaminase n=1 Tax=Saccharomycodes ludwigii TaxID=36035 RepID=A0A376B1B6_9ASCO|nr:uncharacterized protein SCODWIG_00192 [Saccharomycodes ludwigii]
MTSINQAIPLKEKPSMLYSLEENDETNIFTGPSNFTKTSSKLVSSFTSKLTLDDVDMIGLWTKYDTQMFNGSPLFMPEEEERINVNGNYFKDNDYDSEGHIDDQRFHEGSVSNFFRKGNTAKLEKDLHALIQYVSDLREKYTGFTWDNLKHIVSPNEFQNDNAIIPFLPEIPSMEEFENDCKKFSDKIDEFSSGIKAQYIEKKVYYLIDKFALFQNLRCKEENLQSKLVPHRDFYNVFKTDVNLLFNGCFSQQQLNNFIWLKIQQEPDRVVLENGQKLIEIINEGKRTADLGLKIVDDEFLEWYQYDYLPNHININDNDRIKFYQNIVHIFLDHDNFIGGEYLAGLLDSQVFSNRSEHQVFWLSIDFVPKNSDWWDTLNEWVNKYDELSRDKVDWNLRIYRNYPLLFAKGMVKNFKEYLDLLFEPLLKTPSKYKNLLSKFKCFDIICLHRDKYLRQNFELLSTTSPESWDFGDNPSIAYYMYHIYVKVNQINKILHPLANIKLRNNCAPHNTERISQFGKIGNTIYRESIMCNLLLGTSQQLLSAERLWSSPLFTYLYYIFQIGCVFSPLSTVSRFYGGATYMLGKKDGISNHHVNVLTNDISYEKASDYKYKGNPFMLMHEMGIVVSLSSHSVFLNCSYTHDPLLEEYGVAASIYLLSSCDICELALNSVRSSSNERNMWVDESSVHNVPQIRRSYRIYTWKKEVEPILY